MRVLPLMCGAALAAISPAAFAQTQCGLPVPKTVRASLISEEDKAKAQAGDAASELKFALALQYGCGVADDAIAAARWMRRAADHGEAAAQNDLGVMYSVGDGVPKDAAEAIRWYRAAARQGFAAAMFNIGVAYFNGEGVADNANQAYYWLNLAKEGGDPTAPDALEHVDIRRAEMPAAELRISEAYFAGTDVPKDNPKGLHWLGVAADDGEALAQLRLGLLYMNGAGVPQDDSKALQWLLKASKQGQAQADIVAAGMYEAGRGTTKNPHEAQKLYEMAATSGNGDAMMHLGDFYRDGMGGKPDLQRAYMWYWLASIAKAAGSQEAANKASASLNTKQIRNAESDGRQWIAQHYVPGSRLVMRGGKS